MNKLISKKTVIESSQYVKRKQYGAEIWKLSLLFNERKYCMEGPIVSIDVSNGNSHYMCLSRTINVLVK